MSLPRASPPGSGLDSGVLARLVERLGDLDCHSLMVVWNQQVVAEAWWAPYQPSYRHSLYSLTKSLTSVAIGFAVQEGLLSVDDRVLGFFPTTLPCEPCSYMGMMKVRHLLTMSTGHIREPPRWSSGPWTREERRADEDHVYHFLASYVDKEPGEFFMYNTPATFMCGAILKALTGEHVFEYLKPRLFDPLGITDYHCEVNANGMTPAGFGGHFRTEDIAKFGLFLLNRGSWQGKQLLLAEWVDEATRAQVSNANHPSGQRDWSSGYGFQFWKCSPAGVYRGDGLFGQFCIVMPEQSAVVAMTAGSRNMHSMLEVVWDVLLPELSKGLADVGAAPPDLAWLETLQIQPPQTEVRHELSRYSSRTYRLADNALRLTHIAVTDGSDSSNVTFRRGTKSCTAEVGYGRWVETVTGSDKDGMASIFSQIACAGAWHDDTFELKVVYTLTPFSESFKMTFDEEGLRIEYRRHPSDDSDQAALLLGRRCPSEEMIC